MEGGGGGVRGYWMRRKYQRLGGEGRRTKNQRHRHRLGLAGGDGRRRRFWRIRISPSVAFLRRVVSPRRFLASLRDAYVRLMLRIANSPAIAGGGSGGGFCSFGPGFAAPAFGRPAIREYDEKMIVEIYKTLLAQGRLNPLTAGDGARITAAR